MRSKLGRMLREARNAAVESNVTGIPIEDVTEMRAERHRAQHSLAVEAAEAYRAAASKARERGAPEDHIAKAIAMENVRRVGRREFLTRSAAAALALGVFAQPKRVWAAPVKQPSIAIVGGGLAGLRCAHLLWTKYGWTSSVYEANDEVGGRCETQRNFWANGLIAEMHGEYISSEHAAVLNLVRRYNLGLDDTSAFPAGTKDTYWVNGGRYTQAQLNADWQAWAWKLFNDSVKTVPWPQNYNNFTATGQQWDRMSVIDWMNTYQRGGATGNFGAMCLQSLIDEYGGDPSDQSALNHVMIMGYNDSANGGGFQSTTAPVLAGTDERWHVSGGNDQIVDGLVGELPAGTIKTGHALVAVVANASGTYTLSFQNGVQVTVQSVVLALPFKTLRDVDLSRAGLSPLKRTAISSLGMGTNGKMIMQFNGQPWLAGGYTGATYQDNGFISSGWQMAQRSSLGGFTGPTGLWTAFPGGNYTQQVITSYGLTAGSGVSPARLVRDTLAQLEPVLPGVTAAYNGRAWYDFGLMDPFLKGSYSYWRVGQYTGFSGYEGVQEGRIHFAGEHTEVDAQGFMEGAVLSGERCAVEIHTTG